jgi:peptidoglycan/LPS O-acetylase OafA/YrhL
MHFNADDRLLVALAGPMVLSLALLTKVGADRGISRPWMIACGEASYALYLVHMPILIGWKGVHSALTGQPSTYIFAWWEIGVLLVLTLLASFALHYLIESPARQRIRRAADFFWPNPISKPAMPTGSQPPDV